MKYYKVIKGDIYDHTTGYTTVQNELLTDKERHKRFSSLKDNVFKEVEINRNNTYKFFGARFEIKET